MTNRIERELPLPGSLAEVWQALTDPDWLAQWLADEVAMELRPGGEARFRIGAEVRTGWVEEVSPPPRDGREGRGGRLAFWWALDDEPASRVELALTPIEPGSTLLRVVESRPLEVLDLVGIPLPGPGGSTHGPALAAVA